MKNPLSSRTSITKKTQGFEVNFDGLVGPTHHYAGLGVGNIASQKNRALPANPKLAALQGLEKMNYLASMGIKQAVLPPLYKPDLQWLRDLGFTGSDKQVVSQVAGENRSLLSASYSASSMWTANAATVTPSIDTLNKKVHITPANLSSQMHRSMEAIHTRALLKQVFPEPFFIHHNPLPAGPDFSDEGAANHIRLATTHFGKGLNIFVYGKGSEKLPNEKKYEPRQTLEASKAIARLHQLSPEATVFAQQKQTAIDAGVFHNDVISVGNENFFFCHEMAFENQSQVLDEIREKFSRQGNGGLKILEVKEKVISLKDAVSSYLFNSQIITKPNGDFLFLAAEECQKNPKTQKYLSQLIQKDLGIKEIVYLNLKQSMRNGGGPACLRLRVILTPDEWLRVQESVKWTDKLYRTLKKYIEKNYRERLVISQLADPKFMQEIFKINNQLSDILDLKPY